MYNVLYGYPTVSRGAYQKAAPLRNAMASYASRVVRLNDGLVSKKDVEKGVEYLANFL